MTLNKNALSIAVAGALVFASSANAAVTLTAAGSTTPVPVAQELIVPAAGVVIANPANALDITTSLGYSFSDGEVRYARIECSSNVRFESAAISAVTGTATSNELADYGAINGVGTNAIYFSITGDIDGDDANANLATDTFTVNGTRRVMSQAPATCSYSLYDLPSQAQAGGTAGRIATRSGSYVSFAQSYDLVVDDYYTNVADVEADPVFSLFDTTDSEGNLFAANAGAEIGGFSYDVASALSAVTQPIKADGTATTLVDLMAASTALAFAGDFTSASNANGTYTGAALARVFLSTDSCATSAQAATAVTATSASFTIGNAARNGYMLCLQSRGGVSIPVADYTVSLNAVSATPATYAVTNRGPEDLGEITRNGTELQAPLAQLPEGWLSRMVLTNTGSLDRGYEVSVLGETGNTITTGTLTGTVPAGGTIVVDLNTVMTAFTGSPRGTIIATVAGPNSQIQGLYQIVNPASGSISNHVMVRPGSN